MFEKILVLLCKLFLWFILVFSDKAGTSLKTSAIMTFPAHKVFMNFLEG